ncbi:TMEM165/GDT1 family protein [Deltaproteobacteria bacterium TL4]
MDTMEGDSMEEVFSTDIGTWTSSAGAAFVLIFLAELGDKTQLVCMTLAARYRGRPVLIGAIAAFVVLNTLGVLFGASLAAWIPRLYIDIAVALLFGVFGVQALSIKEDEDESDEVTETRGKALWLTAFLMIFLAELGDKTQIAVVGLAGTAPPIPVWVGATLALSASSALGVLAGRTVLQRIPVVLLHRVSGAFFLLLTAFVVARIVMNLQA